MTKPKLPIRNVGAKSYAWLRQVGIHTHEDLERLGAVAAFLKVKRAGFKASLNLLYAMEGALMGCHWQALPDQRRGELLIELDAAEASQEKVRVIAVGRGTRSAGHGDEDGAAMEASHESFFDDPAAGSEPTEESGSPDGGAGESER